MMISCLSDLRSACGATPDSSLFSVGQFPGFNIERSLRPGVVTSHIVGLGRCLCATLRISNSEQLLELGRPVMCLPGQSEACRRHEAGHDRCLAEEQAAAVAGDHVYGGGLPPL